MSARNLNDICQEMVEGADYALAAAVVDQDAGLLLGEFHRPAYFTQTFLDSIAAASVEMFRGKGIRTVEQMLAELRNEPPKNMVREIQMTTDGTYHFMTIVPDRPNVLAILVTSKKANLGMGWASLRSRLKEIAAACP